MENATAQSVGMDTKIEDVKPEDMLGPGGGDTSKSDKPNSDERD